MVKFNRAGFTLVEVLVVTVITGILSTITSSTFGGYFDKARQARSLAYQAQIEKLILSDCVFNDYSCGENVVLNWAFSDGDDGSWTLNENYEIRDYRLRHIPGTGGPHYINLPLTESVEPHSTYRVDVVARDIEPNGANQYGGGIVGFSRVGSGIGNHARFADGEIRTICDVFRSPATPDIRLFVSAAAAVSFDEVSIRKVEGYTAVNDNNDCGIGGEIVLRSDN